MSEYVDSKRQELLEKIARERLARGGGEKSIDGDGKTLLKPTLGERMVLTGFGNIDASDEMSEIQKIMKGMKNTQDTEAYIKSNIDKYPGLKGYDTAKGKAGAIEIVKTEDKLQKGDDYIETTGYSKEALGLDPEKRYEVSTYVPLVARLKKEEDAELRKPAEKLAADQLQEVTDARKSADQRADDAQTDLQEYRLYESKRRAHESEQDRLRRAHELKVQQAEGKANRSQTFDLAVMQLQNNNADRMYRREADERQARRDERKDRQLMILQLMKGLQQMGQSFAI